MRVKDLEKLVNNRIIEKGYNLKENSDDIYVVKQRIKGIVEDILKEQLPDMEFDVHYGNCWHTEQKDNRIYASPRYQHSCDWDISPFELQLHKSLIYTNYRNMGQWVVNKVTVRPFGDDKSFEEVYNDYAKKIEEQIKQREEHEKQKKLEEARLEEARLANFNTAKKEVLDYINKNNLDPKEFTEIARIYNFYHSRFIKGEYHYIFDELKE